MVRRRIVESGFRFYNPSIERWMNRDPLGEEGGINLYAFVQNNPVRWIDPWGLLMANEPNYGGATQDFAAYLACLAASVYCPALAAECSVMYLLLDNGFYPDVEALESLHEGPSLDDLKDLKDDVDDVLEIPWPEDGHPGV